METQYISLNMTPTGVNPCFHISQYDIGRPLGVKVHNGAEVVDLDSYTCTIEATRSDGVAITASVATDDNVGTFETTATMTNKADKYRAQFVIVDGDSNRIASLPFDMDVCKAAMDENAESIEEDASLYQQYTEAVQGAIAEANADIQAEENARIAAVNAEATARANADTTLQNNINAEATARQNADNTLQGNIDSEAATRASADSNLQTQINQIIAPIGEAPSAAEVENARIGADGTVYETLGDAIRTQNSDLKSAFNVMNGNYFIIPNVGAWIDGEYIKDSDGTVGTSDTYHRTDYIEINPNLGKITFTNSGGEYDTKYNAWYDSNKAFIRSFATTKNGAIAIQPPLNAKYMRLSFNNTTTNTIAVNYESPTEVLLSLISGNHSIFRANLNSSDFENGIWHGTGYKDYVANRICTNRGIPVKYGDAIKFVASSYEWDYALRIFASPVDGRAQTELYGSSAWVPVNTTDSFICPYDGYLTINLRKHNDSNITPSNYNITIEYPATGDRYIDNITENLVAWDASSYLRSKFVTHMTHSGDGTYGPNSKRNAVIAPLFFNCEISVVADNGYEFAVQYYDGYEIGQSHLVLASAWLKSFVIPPNSYFCIIVRLSSDAETDSTTQNHLTFGAIATANDIYGKLMPLWDEYKYPSSEGTNYVVSSDLLKRNIRARQLGTLTYHQAFCKYGENYYSIDGSHISVQDSSFAQTDSANLYTGHGNGLQLGNSKYAYASGWDDNNIYKVDLDNLVIDSIIALPTTGYTTGVVDEVKNLAYIFQRDSLPDHEDNYNFIVYDITNDEIISTRKILAYGAMQAADFFNDRIIVLNGLGNSACPNGYRVFDTNGNILVDYYFGDFSADEPEGVCIDRDNHELYISFVDKKVYKVTL